MNIEKDLFNLSSLKNINDFVKESIENANKLGRSAEERKNFEKIITTGTTTVALKAKDAVIVATDRRASLGYMVFSKHAKKIEELTDRIIMTTAGSVGDNKLVADLMRAELKSKEMEEERPTSVKSAATLLARILCNARGFLMVAPIVAGYDNKPMIYSLDPIGGLEEVPDYTSWGSGMAFATGVMESRFKKDIEAKEAKKLAYDAVFTAIKQDMGSGNGIDIYIMKKEGTTKESYTVNQKPELEGGDE